MTEPPSKVAVGAELAMFGVVIVWGIGPPVQKLISAPALVSTFVRLWMSVPAFLIVTRLMGVSISWQTLRRTATTGALLAANMVLVFVTLHHTSVAILSVIQALQPAVVLMVAGRWLGERATRWHIGWTVVGIAGVVIVVLGGDPEVDGDVLGTALSVASMLSFTAYYLLSRRARATTDVHPFEWMTGVMVCAAIAASPVVLLATTPGDFGQLGTADLLYLVVATIVVGVVGHGAMTWVHRFVPAGRSSLYLLGMTVVATLVAWPLLDEPITVIQSGGGMVVLGALAAVLVRPGSVEVIASADPVVAGLPYDR